MTRGREFGVLSPVTWRLADLGPGTRSCVPGWGWGSLPQDVAAADVARW